MRIGIHHRTTYAYETPARSITQLLRLFPRNHEGQSVHRWHLDVDHDAALQMGEDAFGNITHVLSLAGPVETLTLTLEGEVETRDTQGVMRDTIERFPARLYLRETGLTAVTEELRTYAAAVTRGAVGGLNRLHALMSAIHADVAFDTGTTDATTTAADAFALKRGVCQDLSHIFIAAARSLDIPARYVGGHFYRSDGALQQEAGHAWVEAHADDLGWIGFDPANGICVTDAHVRVSMGLDYLGAAPVRGTRLGGAAEKLSIEVRVDQASLQTQG